MKRLENRVALITGASRGIGAAVAKALAVEGAHCVLLGRDVKGLEQTYDAITSAGGLATIFPFDLSKIDELEALGPTLMSRFGRLDIWVANAGQLGTLTPIGHSKIKEWREVYTLNVLANVQMIRTLEPLLKASDAGRAVIIGSDLGEEPEAFWGAYSVSKAAVMMMAKVWAEEVKHTPLKINIICPGAVDTAMLAEAFPGGYPYPNLRTPDEIAPICVECCLPSTTRHGDVVRPA